MTAPFPLLVHRKISTTCFSLLLWLLTSLTSWAQTGYIYLHKRAFNEESSINFSPAISGGPTAVSSLTLNDRATTPTPISGLTSLSCLPGIVSYSALTVLRIKV